MRLFSKRMFRFCTSTMFISLFIFMAAEGSASIMRRSVSSSDESSQGSSRIGDAEVHNFGRAFLNATESEFPMSPLQMILPEDSAIRQNGQISSDYQVLCGVKAPLRSMKRIELHYEQRAVCPFSHMENRDNKRIPSVLNEVRCLCERPAHIASSAHFSCEPVVYSMPVLRLHANTGTYRNSTQEIVLACIPVLKHKGVRFRDDLLIEPLKVSYE
ncbi:hypothetical protein Tcan_10798 [Toxocara canis]|uniref:Uncharacterized protein n=1 Tax=Toxocara canis TaxID=6265 RepID=A0A0B2UX01_TOXCA|nr:hypothetical protein Tcan_10798 [Toxocara canis]